MSGPDPARRAEEARGWLAKADNDFLDIDNNLAAARTPWDAVCFHAQQGAEKSLKAFLVLHGLAPPRTHDLVALLSECAAIQPPLGALASDCELLNVYAVATRYPGSGIEPTRDTAPAVVEAARRVRAAISA